MARYFTACFRRSSLKYMTALATLAAGATLAVRSPTLAQRDATVARPQSVQVDWPEAARDALALSPDLATPPAKSRQPAAQGSRAARRLESFALKDGMEPLANLSEFAAPHFPAAASSPVPVLAPVDPGVLLREAPADKKARVRARSASLGPSIEALSMVSDSSGYDIAATVGAPLLSQLGITIPYKPQLFIGGSSVTYSNRQAGDLVADMQSDIPGLRRIAGPEEVIYVFKKYGVPYFVSLDCSAMGEQGVLACTQADAIIRVVLKSLRLIGGGPRAMRPEALRLAEEMPAPHPTKVDPDFKYHKPGSCSMGPASRTRGAQPTSRSMATTGWSFP